MNLYTIYDKVADQAGPLFEAKNDAIAVRQACQILRKVPQRMINDYKLINVGMFVYEDGVSVGEILNDPKEVDYIKAFDEMLLEEAQNEK